MKVKVITIVCDNCQRNYVVYNGGGARRNLIFDYAICPHCREPRCPWLWEGRDRNHICRRCSLPAWVVKMDKIDLCHACNIFELRARAQKNV